jgi:hypothetical protein
VAGFARQKLHPDIPLYNFKGLKTPEGVVPSIKSREKQQDRQTTKALGFVTNP